MPVVARLDQAEVDILRRAADAMQHDLNLGLFPTGAGFRPPYRLWSSQDAPGAIVNAGFVSVTPEGVRVTWKGLYALSRHYAGYKVESGTMLSVPQLGNPPPVDAPPPIDTTVSGLTAYQRETRKTAVYPKDTGLEYTIIGLANEAGEILGKLKKWMRGDYSRASLMEKLPGEIGDALYYVARAADEAGLTLEEVAQANLRKLSDRQKRGKIKGDGDNR